MSSVESALKNRRPKVEGDSRHTAGRSPPWPYRDPALLDADGAAGAIAKSSTSTIELSAVPVCGAAVCGRRAAPWYGVRVLVGPWHTWPPGPESTLTSPVPGRCQDKTASQPRGAISPTSLLMGFQALLRAMDRGRASAFCAARWDWEAGSGTWRYLPCLGTPRMIRGGRRPTWGGPVRSQRPAPSWKSNLNPAAHPTYPTAPCTSAGRPPPAVSAYLDESADVFGFAYFVNAVGQGDSHTPRPFEWPAGAPAWAERGSCEPAGPVSRYSVSSTECLVNSTPRWRLGRRH